MANGLRLRVKPHYRRLPGWALGKQGLRNSIVCTTSVSVCRMARSVVDLHGLATIKWVVLYSTNWTLAYNSDKVGNIQTKHYFFSLVSCATAYKGRSLPCLSQAPNLTKFPFHFHSKVVSKNFMGAGAGGQLFQRPPSYSVSS